MSGTNRSYKFNGSISLEVLNNYLDRAIDCNIRGKGGKDYDPKFTDEIIRFITNIGAKYVLRADGEWYPSIKFEQNFAVLTEKLAAAHKIDPDIIFEASIFEVSSPEMKEIPIPEWVFEAFGQKPEKRCFNTDLTVFSDGYGVDYWEKGYHIPDITTREMQMFVYYRACSLIDVGFEAFHLGQVLLTGRSDPQNIVYTKLIGMIREYAKTHARRGYVIINAHNNNFKDTNGTMLVDMIVAPTRVHSDSKNEVNHAASEENPQRCIIEPGYWNDSIYCSNGPGTSPSGWHSDKYPYLVHLDNYGDTLGDTTDKDCYVWGRDEIGWYVNQPAWYRREFMKEIREKIAGYNENGHIAAHGWSCGWGFFSNNKSEQCPNGSGDEETIKKLFSE